MTTLRDKINQLINSPDFMFTAQLVAYTIIAFILLELIF